ncbi:MAG: SMP-30/gluconolactonase/LRE family protein [Halioglobus sp.]
MNRILSCLLACLVALASACSDSNHSSSSPPPLPDRLELGSPDSVPEGVAFDPQERAFFATSLQGGSIVRIDAAGRESVFRAADNRARLVGTKVDAQHRRLWVCAQQVDGVDNRVWVYGLDTGQLDLEFLLGALTTNGSCNDIALDRTGAAYVTDPANPYVYRLDPVSGRGAVLVTDPLLADISGAALGLNGIALTPDESALIVGKFVPAGLLRVSLPAGDSVTPIALSGPALPAPDGLAVLDGDLYAVSGDSVSRVRFDAGFTAGTVVTVPQQSGLSTATVAESRLYVIKSEVLNFVLGRPLDTPFAIFRVDLDAFGP